MAIHISELDLWQEWAKRDKAFALFVPSDIRQMLGEIVRLRQREADALKLLHGVFGEYACMIKAHLSEKEIALFEANFAVPARAFIGAKRFGR